MARASVSLSRKTPVIAPSIKADDKPEVVVAPAFRTRAEPGGIMVISVPLPADIRATAESRKTGITYRVIAVGGTRVLSRTVGSVASSDTSVGVTLSVSRAIRAGRSAAAQVEFTAGTVSTLSVPIELEVAATRNLQLAVPDAFTGAVRGAVTSIRFEVSNRGNDNESFQIKSVLPQGWRSTLVGVAPSITLSAGASMVGTLRVTVPAHAQAGQALARITLVGGGVTLATSEVRVDVRDAAAGSANGPTLVMTAVGAAAPDGAASGYAATLSGNISDSTQISARMALSGNTAGASAYGLARSGALNAPPSVSITSPHLDVAAGSIGMQLSELSGMYLNGIGASSRYAAGPYTLKAFAGRPFGMAQNSFFSTAPGTLAGLSVERVIGSTRTAVQGVHLANELGLSTLDALSVTSRVAGVAGGELSGEFGYRKFDADAGMGMSAQFTRTVGGSSIDVRALHAPGGSQAYARAANDLTITGSQRLGSRFLLAGGAWSQRDERASLGETSNGGWYVSPSLSLRKIGTTIGLEGRQNSFTSTTTAGRYANSEQQLGGSIDTRYQATFISIRSTYGTINRTIDIANAPLPTAEGKQLNTRVAVGANLGGGNLEASWNSQQFSGTAGLLPEQQTIAARIDRVRMPFTTARPVYLNAEVQRFATGAVASGYWSYRTGLTVALPRGLALSMQAEHNPFIAAGNRSGGDLLYTMRLDRTSILPRLNAKRDQSLFVDADGNGKRDDRESGVAGIVVECGAATVVSDKDGRFACPQGAAIVVDARSVPTGLLAPAIRAGNAVRGDIALRPVAVRKVQLALVEADTFRVRESDLARVIVVARDSIGTPWAARSTGNGAFVFDALPPGRYQLEVDADAIAEPLRPANALPELVNYDGDATAIVIALKPRAVRIKQIGTRSDSTKVTGVVAPSGATSAPAPSSSKSSKVKQQENEGGVR